MLVREFAEGQEIDQVLLVRGGPRPKLGDRTGTVAAAVAAGADCCLEPGSLVRVTGRFAGGELEVRTARAAVDGEYDLADLLDGPPRAATGMEADLRELLATVQNSHLRALLDAVFGPQSPTWKQFRDAPAAKRYHQAYRHGLLEHSLTVAQAVSAISATFPGIDRDVAVTGALLRTFDSLSGCSQTGSWHDLAGLPVRCCPSFIDTKASFMERRQRWAMRPTANRSRHRIPG
jgi:3'-5' exoribonuclease